MLHMTGESAGAAAEVADDHRIEKDQPARRLPQAEAAPRAELLGRRDTE
jgi:hypothetical protein